MDAAIAAGTWNAAGKPEETTLAGRRTLRFRPDRDPAARVLHLHGGGFRLGCPDVEIPFSAALVERCGVEVVVPQYRLAPEHPFPSGLVDAHAALVALREEIGDGPLIVSGDSAGGGLAASLAVLAAAGGAPKIDALILISPWLDLTVTAGSYTANAASDPLFSRESAAVAAELYLQGEDPLHPLVSPLYAPFVEFPPTMVSVGRGEVLADDSLRFHDRLTAAGLSAQLCAIDGMDHVAVIRGMDLPGSVETFEAVTAFIDSCIGGRAPGENQTADGR